MPAFDSNLPKRPALLIAHPGHELRVFGWLATFGPEVSILADGSGGAGAPRIAHSVDLIERSGASVSPICGVGREQDFYDAILRRDGAFFRSLVDRFTEVLVSRGVDFVACDAAEGFNPIHDLCAAVAGAGAARASRRLRTKIPCYEFALAEWETGARTADLHDAGCVHFDLSDALFARKLDVARHYAPLAHEIDGAIAALGEDYFRTECFRRSPRSILDRHAPSKPHYERFGEQRVAQGAFRTVICYREHVRPILEALFVDA